jgi:hypothetical protein
MPPYRTITSNEEPEFSRQESGQKPEIISGNI